VLNAKIFEATLYLIVSTISAFAASFAGNLTTKIALFIDIDNEIIYSK
jgi:hypothetical protein